MSNPLPLPSTLFSPSLSLPCILFLLATVGVSLERGRETKGVQDREGICGFRGSHPSSAETPVPHHTIRVRHGRERDCISLHSPSLLPFPFPSPSTLLKTSYATETLSSEILKLRDDLVAGMGRHDASSLDSFITVYGYLCDLHGLPYLKDVASVSTCSHPMGC